MTNAATVGRPCSSRTRSVTSTDGRIVNRIGASLRKPSPAIPGRRRRPASLRAGRRRARRAAGCGTRPRGRRARRRAAACRTVSRSSQRSATSAAEMVCAGRGSMLKPRGPREKTRCACGLETRSGAVTPASLRTLTRKVRQPRSTSSARAGPGATFTRLSGLMWTSSRQCGSRMAWIAGGGIGPCRRRRAAPRDRRATAARRRRPGRRRRARPGRRAAAPRPATSGERARSKACGPQTRRCRRSRRTAPAATARTRHWPAIATRLVLARRRQVSEPASGAARRRPAASAR